MRQIRSRRRKGGRERERRRRRRGGGREAREALQFQFSDSMGEDVPLKCRSKVEALTQCEKRHSKDPFVCNHLNNAAALCLVSFICPSQLEAVQSYCRAFLEAQPLELSMPALFLSTPACASLHP
ncbi:hypothetical protein GOP47_0020707 [Adiantum capillus-veneris]|uniref:COX assembly mitochondrial protein n=1 Tax=Adiantum capillus-veneris TaxID=13818 RepID=A0A9D4UA17_ADICA|nr:hypothetical protein GOP47_0020707 [Adiantum capillus-veneris]